MGSDYGRPRRCSVVLRSVELPPDVQSNSRTYVDSLDSQHSRPRPQHGPAIFGDSLEVHAIRVPHATRPWRRSEDARRGRECQPSGSEASAEAQECDGAPSGATSAW